MDEPESGEEAVGVVWVEGRPQVQTPQRRERIAALRSRLREDATARGRFDRALARYVAEEERLLERYRRDRARGVPDSVNGRPSETLSELSQLALSLQSWLRHQSNGERGGARRPELWQVVALVLLAIAVVAIVVFGAMPAR